MAVIAGCTSLPAGPSGTTSSPGLTPTPSVAASGGPTDALIGTWEATDVDGSHMTLTVEPAPDGALAVSLDDAYAAFCARPGAGRIPYTAEGVGVHEGDKLRVDVNAEHCGMLDIHADELTRTDSMELTYDSARDELTGLDVTWERR